MQIHCLLNIKNIASYFWKYTVGH